MQPLGAGFRSGSPASFWENDEPCVSITVFDANLCLKDKSYSNRCSDRSGHWAIKSLPENDHAILLQYVCFKNLFLTASLGFSSKRLT
jgi:hypothetical protein